MWGSLLWCTTVMSWIDLVDKKSHYEVTEVIVSAQNVIMKVIQSYCEHHRVIVKNTHILSESDKKIVLKGIQSDGKGIQSYCEGTKVLVRGPLSHCEVIQYHFEDAQVIMRITESWWKSYNSRTYNLIVRVTQKHVKITQNQCEYTHTHMSMRSHTIIARVQRILVCMAMSLCEHNTEWL